MLLQYSYFQLSGMKLKDKQTSHFPIKSSLKSNIFDPPICVISSMESSVKKSSRSTYLTERSSSRNKVMIPNSHKLANFFTSTRPYSSQKSFSTTSTDNIVRNRCEEKKPKVQFLKHHLNRDYFDENTQQDLIGQINKNKQPCILNYKDQQKRVLRGQLNQLHSYKSETLFRNESPKVALPKIKHPSKKIPPHFFNRGNEKVNIKTKKDEKYKIEGYGYNKCKQKNGHNKELQYTFGLNY